MNMMVFGAISAVTLAVLLVGVFVLVDQISGAAERRKEDRERVDRGRDRLMWALGGVLDGFDQGDLAVGTWAGRAALKHAADVWRDEDELVVDEKED